MDSRIGMSKILSTQCTSEAKIQKEIRRKSVTIEMIKAVSLPLKFVTKMEAFVLKFKRFFILSEIQLNINSIKQ